MMRRLELLILFIGVFLGIGFVGGIGKVYAGCTQGPSCGLAGHWEYCSRTCDREGDHKYDDECFANKCCGGGGVIRDAGNCNCYVDCTTPPVPKPPVCAKLKVEGNPLDNENLTVDPNVNVTWSLGGDSPDDYRLDWDKSQAVDPWTWNWRSYSGPPARISLDDGIGWYEVRAQFRNDDGTSDVCRDKILYDHLPNVGADPKLTGHWADWSGTEKDSDNNASYKNGKDYNPMTFTLRASDPDGVGDIKFINFGIGGLTSSFSNSDNWVDESCSSDPLESILSNSGFGITINFDHNGKKIGVGNICGGNDGGRYSVQVGESQISGKTLTIQVTVTFKKGIDEGMQYVWGKVGDWQGAYSGPSGSDRYSNLGTWGIDLTMPDIDNRGQNGFAQKQPLTAKSVRVWWDATDTYSGIRSIEKGCSKNGKVELSNRGIDGNVIPGNGTEKNCYGLKVYTGSDLNPTVTGWDDIILKSTDGISTFSTDLLDPNDPSFPSGYKNYRNDHVGYEEEVYVDENLNEGDGFVFSEWITDGANNMEYYKTDDRKIGASWLQVISGDVYGKITSFKPVPDDSFDGQGYAQLIKGLSSVIFRNSDGDISTVKGKAGGSYVTTNDYVGNATNDYIFDYGPDWFFGDGSGANMSVFDSLKEEAVNQGHEYTLCGRAGGDKCAHDARLAGAPIFDKSGIYYFHLTQDTSINGPSLAGRLWSDDNVHGKNIVALVEGDVNLSLIPTFDPPFNLILITRVNGVTINTVGDDKMAEAEHGFEADFKNVASTGNFCGHFNPVLGANQPCYGVPGKGSTEEWNKTNHRDKDTYIIPGYDYKSIDDYVYGSPDSKNAVVDPGVDMFGVYLITSSDVVVANEEDDFGGKLRSCIEREANGGPECNWDGDFERLEIRGGIVAGGPVTFKRNLITLDNYWIPSEKMLYSPGFINTYIKATTGIRSEFAGAEGWEEVGFDY